MPGPRPNPLAWQLLCKLERHVSGSTQGEDVRDSQVLSLGCKEPPPALGDSQCHVGWFGEPLLAERMIGGSLWSAAGPAPWNCS